MAGSRGQFFALAHATQSLTPDLSRFPDEDLATLKNMGDLTTLIRKLS